MQTNELIFKRLNVGVQKQTIKNNAWSVELYQRNRVRSKERIPFKDCFVFLSFFVPNTNKKLELKLGIVLG